MNYYDEIKNKLIDNEINKRVKNHSINKTDLSTYYTVGEILKKADKQYGEGIIKEYSKKLTNELGKGYSKRNLWLMMKFYEFNEKVQTLSAQLTWSHYCELLVLQNIEEIQYYIAITEKNNLTVRQLREKLKNNGYNRLPKDVKFKEINNNPIVNTIKNPILIKSNLAYSDISEKTLQKLILEDIPSFLKELGQGFSFIENEYKIKIGNQYNYIDLLLYNIKYKCYVVVELKISELKKEHIGQIQIYMNYIDKNIKSIDENKTIGIIIVKKENEYILEYCSDERIISRRFCLI